VSRSTRARTSTSLGCTAMADTGSASARSAAGPKTTFRMSRSRHLSWPTARTVSGSRPCTTLPGLPPSLAPLPSFLTCFRRRLVSNITYAGIALYNISNYGVVIEQDYENGSPTGVPTSGVPITNLTLAGIVGTVAPTAQDYYILCGSGACGLSDSRTIVENELSATQLTGTSRAYSSSVERITRATLNRRGSNAERSSRSYYMIYMSSHRHQYFDYKYTRCGTHKALIVSYFINEAASRINVDMVWRQKISEPKRSLSGSLVTAIGKVQRQGRVRVLLLPLSDPILHLVHAFRSGAVDVDTGKIAKGL
jgi:hypothetical protein